MTHTVWTRTEIEVIWVSSVIASFDLSGACQKIIQIDLSGFQFLFLLLVDSLFLL